MVFVGGEEAGEADELHLDGVVADGDVLDGVDDEAAEPGLAAVGVAGVDPGAEEEAGFEGYGGDGFVVDGGVGAAGVDVGEECTESDADEGPVPPFHAFYEAHISAGFAVKIKLEHVGGFRTR